MGVVCVFAGGAVDFESGSVGAGDDGEPNDVGGGLEFRIAPQKTSTAGGASPLTAKEIGQWRKNLAENGPSASMKNDDRFIWMKIMPGVKLSEYLTIEEHEGAEYLLVHNWPAFVMSSGVNWGLQSVRKGAADNVGRPYVGFELDHGGADLFQYLTASNIGEALAIIIEGDVVSAPSIATVVRSQAIITGDFSEGQIDDMIKVLRKVRPVSITAAPPTRRVAGTYLIPILMFVLVVCIVGFLIYRPIR